jgi:hypothetical protein
MSLLFNPTPVELVGKWDGSNYIIPAEGSVELPERVAAHILNHLNPRGLVELKHGDKKGVKGEAGLDTWKEFERRQILEFRQINENRKSAGFPPLTPSKMLLDMVRRCEGDESAERLEYASAETATMLLQQMVKGQTEGQGDIAEAVVTLTNAMAQMMAQQQQDREVLMQLVGKLGTPKEETDGG